jgi:hypothetical protein
MTVTWQTLGAFATGAASAAPGLPASTAVGDLLIIGCAFGNLNDAALDTPSGWTVIPNTLEFGGDGAAYGVDAGNRGVIAFMRIADGTEGATITVSNNGTGTTTRVTSAQIMRFTKTGASFFVSATNGEDNTDAVGYSATGDSVLIPANGDQGIAVTAWNPDSATAGTPTLTWDGVANTATAGQTIASTQGNDVRFLIYRRNLAGTGGSAPVFATTASAAVTGATAFILIHDGTTHSGQAIASFGFTATALGVAEAGAVQGQAAGAFGFTATANGIDRALGQAAASLGFTGTANGIDRALGAALASFGFTATALGIDRSLGQAVASFGGTLTASGSADTPAVQGQAVATFGFTATGNGIDRALGAAAGAFGFAATAVGVDRALGNAVASFGFTGTANGIDRALGQAVASFGPTTTADGVRRPRGAGVASFGFTATASGTADSLPVSGQAAASFGFTATATGIDRTLGVATAPFGFTAASAGIDRTLGAALASFGFTGAGSGLHRLFGQVLASFGFTATASGTVILPSAAPASRISVAEAEDRTSVALAATSRTSVAVASSRTSTSTAQSRVSSSSASSRTSS